MSKNQSIKIIFPLAIMVMTAVACMMWMLSTTIVADDYLYATEFSGIHEHYVCDSLGRDVTSFNVAARSAMNHYGSENGRLANIAYIMCQPLGTDVIKTICGLMMVAMYLLLVWPKEGKLPGMITAAAGAVMMWCAFPWYNYLQASDFQANYVWTSVLVLLFIRLAESSGELSWMRQAVTALIGVAIGWMHEGFMIAAMAWLFVMMISEKRLKKGNLWIFMAALAVGGAINIFGGTFTRAVEEDAMEGLLSAKLTWKQWIVQLWPLLLASLIVTRRTVPLFASACVVAVMAAVLGQTGRVMWPMDLMCALIVIDRAALLDLKDQHTKLAIAAIGCFIAVYGAWIYQLVKWQLHATAQHVAVQSALSPRHSRSSGVISADVEDYDASPWYLMDMTSNYLTDKWNSTCVGSYYLGGDVAFIIADKQWASKPFEQWPDAGCDGAVRGRWPMIATRDSSLEKIRLKFVTPGWNETSPLGLAWMLLRKMHTHSPAEAEVSVMLMPVFTAENDTVYRIFPTLPKFVSTDSESVEIHCDGVKH